MPAKHVKARHWVATGIFDALTSFHDFEQRINALAEEKTGAMSLRFSWKGFSPLTTLCSASPTGSSATFP